MHEYIHAIGFHSRKIPKQQNKAMVPEVKIVAIRCRVVNYSKGAQKGF